MPPSTAVIETRCLGGRFTRIRMTLDVKYVPISIEISTDIICAGMENLHGAEHIYSRGFAQKGG